MSLRAILLNYLPSIVPKTINKVKASPLASRLAHGVLWALIGDIVARLLGFASFIVVARVIGKASYGQFGVIQSTVAMFGVFAGFGLGSTATRYVAELRGKDPQRAGRIMGIAGIMASITGILMAVLMFFFAPWLAKETLADPAMAPLLRIGALILIVEAMNGAQIGALSGFEAFKTIAKISTWVGLASFPTMAIGAYIWGLEGSVWGLVLVRTWNWLLNHIAVRQEAKRLCVPFIFHGAFSEISVLWHYSIPSMLSGLMVAPTIWICNAMLVNQPNGYEQMGIFQAADSFRMILLFVGNSLSAPLMPILASQLGSFSQNDRLSRFNILSTWFLGSVAALCLGCIPEIAILIYGREFADQEFTRTVIVIVFCASIVIYKQGLARVLSVHGLMWWGMLSNLVWAATLVPCMWLFKSWGAVGYAAALACAYGINTVLFIPLYTKKNLVPKGTIISLEACMIWVLLIGAIGMNFIDVSINYRLLYLPIGCVTMCWLFWRLLTRPTLGDVTGV